MSRRKTPRARDHYLDLQQRHFTRTKHGFEVIGTWCQERPKVWKPCLVILPAVRQVSRRIVPCVIPLNNAWIWAMHGDVGDPAAVIEQTAEWFEEGVLPGAAFDKRDHMRLLDAVNESLPDLISMPPRPKGDTVIYGDIILRKETGEIIEREAVQDV